MKTPTNRFLCGALILTLWAPLAAGRQSESFEMGSLQVQVRTKQGEIPPGTVHVMLYMGAELIDEGECDSDGLYDFGALVSQRYIVEATAPGYERASERLWLQPARRRRVLIELAETGEAPFDPSSQSYWFRGKPRARGEVFKARQLRVRGDSEGAIARLERALEEDPQFSVAHNELGLCFMDLNRLDEARTSFARAVELGPALIHCLNLTDVLLKQGEIEEARAIVTRAAELHTERAEPEYVLARIELNAGDVEAASQSAHRALARNHSQIPQLHLLLADIYGKRGELYRVPQELETYLSKNPDGSDVESVRSRLEQARKELKSIEIPLKQYAELMKRYRNGQHLDTAAALARFPREVTRKASRFYMKDPMTESQILSAAMLHTDAALVPGSERGLHVLSASEYLRQLEEPRRESFEKQWSLALAYYFLNQQQFVFALPFLSTAARKYPDDLEIVMALGTTCEAMGWIYGFEDMTFRAELAYRAVLAKDAENVEARLRLGHILKMKGLFEESLLELNWTVNHTEEPRLTMIANLLLGDIHRMHGNTDLAVQCYQKAVELDPDCQVAVTALSHALLLTGNSVGSHQMVGQLLERRIESPEGKDGWWRYLLGHAEQAEEMMLRMRGGFLE
jgi:tetratricopeptide (TPR) repeat protein